MAKQKTNKPRRSRLWRIERQCDRILSEVLILRQVLRQKPTDLDDLIERMHESARSLRLQCERERDVLQSMLIKQATER